jgi:hypothetical protein
MGHKRISERFAISDHVLLLFNQHDTRIALDWEPHPADRGAEDEAAPDATSLRRRKRR